MGAEAYAQLSAVATKLSALNEALLLKADEFEAADLQTQSGLAGLFARFRSWLDSLGLPLGSQPSTPWAFLAPEFEWLFKDRGPEDEGQPWYTQLAIELSKAWAWYHRTVNLPIYDSLETWRGIRENGNKVALYYLAQIWSAYDKAVNQPIYETAETWRGNLVNARTIVLYSLSRLWFGYDAAVNERIYGVVEALPDDPKDLFVVQTPLSGPDGPISDWLITLAATDPSGNPISPVGTELANLMGDRITAVTFLDLPAGVVPWRGYVILPEYMSGMPGTSLAPGSLGFLSHEFTHVLQRELPGERYWPDGGLSLVGVRLLGDSTNYMEVMSEIVGLTVEYDLRFHDNPLDPDLSQIRDQLATYTDNDALNASRFLVSDSWNSNDPSENQVYRANYVHELLVNDHRIPGEGWDYWLKEMGFTNETIQHIRDIASQGSLTYIDEASLDAQNGEPVTPPATPTTTSQSSGPPTPSPTPTPTPSLTPSPSTTPTPTPTPTPTATSTPSPTPTPSPSPTQDSH